MRSFSKYLNDKDKVTLHSEPKYIQSHTVFITVVFSNIYKLNCTAYKTIGEYKLNNAVLWTLSPNHESPVYGLRFRCFVKDNVKSCAFTK